MKKHPTIWESATSSASVISLDERRSSRSRGGAIADTYQRWQVIVRARLDELCGLNEGWDGYGGRAVTFSAAEFALSVIDELYDSRLPLPHLVPGSDGDLQIEWDLGNGEIELHVLGPNRVDAWWQSDETDTDGEEVELTTDFGVVVGWLDKLMEAPVDETGTAS